jgi:sugar phosphate isomerase/epimerase
MINKKIGVATSIFAEKSFDPFITIDYCKKNGISTIQHYLAPNHENDVGLIEKIKVESQNANLKVICHAHYPLDFSILEGDYLRNISKIFPDSEQKLLVVHFNENKSADEAISVLKIINSFGLTVALENFYIGKSEESLNSNSENYLKVLSRAVHEKLNILPLIDFPRLFIKQFAEFNPLIRTEDILNKLSDDYSEIVLHLIDFNSNRQERDDWVPIGDGLMPYGKIFDLLRKCNLTVDSAIIEYESAQLATGSLDTLNKLL